MQSAARKQRPFASSLLLQNQLLRIDDLDPRRLHQRQHPIIVARMQGPPGTVIVRQVLRHDIGFARRDQHDKWYSPLLQQLLDRSHPPHQLLLLSRR